MIDESLLKSGFTGKDGFTWWIGRVADSNVWFKQNKKNAREGKISQRCKVRIIGYHPWDGTQLKEEDLPWAHILMDPITGSGQGGLGDTSVLTGGETCVGFFLDGEEAQQPVIIGLLHRSEEVKNTIRESEMQLAKSSRFRPFTGHPKNLRKQDGPGPTKKPGVETGGINNSSESTGQVNTNRVSDSNRSVFSSLTDGQRDRILSAPIGTNVEGVNVSESMKFELRQFEMETPASTVASGSGKGSGSEASVNLNNDKVSEATAAAEKKFTKKYRRPTGCGDNPISEVMGQVQDFISMVDGLEQSLDTYVDPIRNKVIDMEQQAKKTAAMVGSVIKGIVNNLRDSIIKKVVSLFSIFGALQKKLNPTDQVTGPAMWKGAKKILELLFCIFEKVIGMMLNFLSNMFKNMLGQIVNGPVCAAEQFVDGILAKVFDLIEDIAGPILQGIDWLTGGLSSITGVLGQVSSLARQIFSFLACDDIKCHEPTEWESGNSASIKLPSNNWAERIAGVNKFKGIQNTLQGIANDIDVNTDTGLLAQTNVDGSSILGILQATDALTGGNSAGLANKGLGSIESAIAGISLFGNGNKIFNACDEKIKNPQTQDDIIDMPIGYKYHTCIPPVAKLNGDGSGAEIKAIVGSDTSIFSIEVIKKGSGYTKSRTGVAIIDKTRHGSGANARVVVDSDGSIKEIIVLSGGRGYCGGGRTGEFVIEDGITIEPSPGTGTGGGSGGVGVVTSIVAIRPGIGYTSGDSVIIFDPYKGIDPSVGGGTTTGSLIVTPRNGSIIGIEVPTNFNYEFTTRASVVIDSENGSGAKLIPVMRDKNQSSVDDIVRPLVGISSVIDCPTDEHLQRR